MKKMIFCVFNFIVLAIALPAQDEGAKLVLTKDLGQGRVVEVYAVDLPVDQVYRALTPEQEKELREDAKKHGREHRVAKPYCAIRSELYIVEGIAFILFLLL